MIKLLFNYLLIKLFEMFGFWTVFFSNVLILTVLNLTAILIAVLI